MVKSLNKAAGFIIYRQMHNRPYEYLLMQASYEPHHWTPPKGHMKDKETEMDTAIRETLEETGIKFQSLELRRNFIKILRYDLPGSTPVSQRVKQVTYWLAFLKYNDIEVEISDEHQNHMWLPLREAKEKVVFSQMQNLLDECERYLTFTPTFN